MVWCNASRSGGEGDDLPLTQGAGTWEGGYSAVCEAETTLPSISERVSTLEMQPDRNPPTITRTASNLRTGNSFFSAASALPSWPWRPAPGRRERQSHLLYASVLLVVGAFLLGVGFCIGQSRAISSRSEGSVKFFPPSGLGQVKADWPTHSLLGNTWSPRDVEPLFTAYHFTDAHIEPLYDKHVVVKGNCRKPDCCKKGENVCEAFTYDESELPTLGCDPPVSLLEGVLEAMQAVDPEVSYVLFTGDMNAHHLCNEELVRTTQNEFMRRVHRALPHLPFVYAIGNNDLWPNSKNSEHNFEALYQVQLKHCPQCAIFQGTEEEKAENARTFRAGGYYRFRDHAKHVRILVVNSGLWAPRYDNSDLPVALPDAHMDWVENELEAAKEGGEQVVLISHIPPGHVRHSADWNERFLDRYIALCTRFAGTITAQLYGHHSKEYIRSFSPEVGVLVSAGVTPLGGGSLTYPGEKDAANPTFRHLIFTKSGFYDMWSFYLDLSSGERERFLGEKRPRTSKTSPATPGEKAREESVGGGFLFPSSTRKEKDREAFVSALESAAAATPVTAMGRGDKRGVSAKFLEAVKAANSKGWDLMYSFRQTYKCPDVSPASIHLAADRILRDSHYTTRYEMYLGGLHSPHRLITCDVHTRTWDSEEVETCFDRLCLYDVSQECAALEPKKKKKHHHQMV
ncbi:acid sphingomyelinase-like phosphodiesterase 3b [Nannochloropsis gaditana]|uniref:Acid sphingomyelinase-like phosphodiesterase 3b n=1 Tax=Nannochloropsis gaditana TaxID=72520 RepID=W7TQ09_9STRA|nr:acid sphingomyelinase-like phosphodiesterase 3b [Nannochloropsis gaditana]